MWTASSLVVLLATLLLLLLSSCDISVLVRSRATLAPSTFVTIDADDSRIVYSGRFDDRSRGSRSFSWVASEISVRFTGSIIEANLTAPSAGDRFLVIVDNQEVRRIVIEASVSQVYILAWNLPTRVHTLRLIKLTEDFTGPASFHGFRLPAGGSFQSPLPKRSRRLQFIGDSDTAGWCADGSPLWPVKTDPNDVEDHRQTWAAQMAEAFDAEHQVQAVSGIGIITESRGAAIGAYMDKVLTNVSSPVWNHSSWVPHAVVSLIGPNDDSDRDDFEALYLDFMESIATLYKSASEKPKIVNVCGGSINGLDPCQKISKAVLSFNANRTDGFDAHYVTIARSHWYMINMFFGHSPFNGCQMHYSHRGHAVLLQDILAGVKEILAWQTVDEFRDESAQEDLWMLA
eukprot:TRINITY_DN69167_c0_g1_i1.p1 TRINITY_DN69167_c0_g1~~TRINITY_DN69167_c0_g1_i1.p1  ORF type:complete len:402 (-),score=26.71 TRINITY_DN69167_c0_g1_i1:243-1448(-)